MDFIELFKRKTPNIDIDLLTQYLDICVNNNKKEHIKGVTEYHHILPVNMFKEYKNLKNNIWNGTYLTYEEHYRVHAILAEMTNDSKCISAWWAMNNKNSKSGKFDKPIEIIGEKMYAALKKKAIKTISDNKKGKVVITENGINRYITSEEYKSGDYESVSKGKLNVIIKESGEKIMIDSSEYNTDLHLFHTVGKVVVQNRETLEWVSLTKEEYNNNKDTFKHTSTDTVNIRVEGKVMKVTKEEFDKGSYKGVANDTVTVKNIIDNTTLRVTYEEFLSNKNLIGTANNKFFIIDDIPMRSCDAETYIREKGYKSSIHNFIILKNKSTFVKEFRKISLDEYIGFLSTFTV